MATLSRPNGHEILMVIVPGFLRGSFLVRYPSLRRHESLDQSVASCLSLFDSEYHLARPSEVMNFIRRSGRLFVTHSSALFWFLQLGFSTERSTEAALHSCETTGQHINERALTSFH